MFRLLSTIRVINLCLFIVLLFFSIDLYAHKANTALSYKRLEQLKKQLAEQEKIRDFLTVEKSAHLRADRLEIYARDWLGLKKITNNQILSYQNLPDAKIKNLSAVQKQKTIEDIIAGQ